MASLQQENPHLKHMEELRQDAEADYMAGRYKEAEGKFRRLVPLQQRVHGMENEATLDSMMMLGSMLRSQGRYNEAERLYQDVLQIKQQSADFGVENPSTLSSARQLASVMTMQGRWKQAEPMLRKLHATHVRVLGPLDPLTLSVQISLGAGLMNHNQPQEAEGLLRGACEGCKLHTDMGGGLLSSYMLLFAQCLSKLSKNAEAEPMAREAVDLAVQALGEDEQGTIAAREVLGVVLVGLGRHAEAEAVYQLALQSSRAVHGWAGAPTLNVVNELACCLGAAGKALAVEDLLRDTVTRVQQAFGNAHPTTKLWERYLAMIEQQIKDNTFKRMMGMKIAKEPARAKR